MRNFTNTFHFFTRAKTKKLSCNLDCCSDPLHQHNSVSRNLNEVLENIDDIDEKTDPNNTENNTGNDADTEESDEEMEWKPKPK